MITRTFKLCLNAGTGSAPFINVSQTDKDEVWLFELYTETGERYIPSSGAIIGIKSDGHGIANTGTVDSEGRVVITETEQMTAAAGRSIFELSIDGLTHGTANFIVNVEKKPIDGAIMSDSDLSLISQAVDSAAVIVDVIGDGDPSEVIGEHVDAWLDNHPEATTTVLDEAITAPKINNSLWDKLLVSEEASGNPASFDDGADDVPVSSLKVNLEPIQTGTGDPSPSNVRPIVASNGKNLLNIHDASGWTIPSGGELSVSGETVSMKILASGSTRYTLNQHLEGNKTVAITFTSSKVYGRFFVALRKMDDSGWMTNSDASIEGMTYNQYYNGWFTYFSDTSASQTITIPNCLYWQFGLGYGNNGVVIGETEAIYNPMIRLASITDSSYQPYQGIAVRQTGKNLLNVDDAHTAKPFMWESGWSYTTPYGENGLQFKLTLEQGGQGGVWTWLEAGKYTLSFDADFENATKYGFNFRLYNPVTAVYTANDSPNKLTDPHYTYTFECTTESVFMLRPFVVAWKTDAPHEAYFNKIMLEYGESESVFEPYQGTNYYTNLGQNVYGGTVDLATGVLTVTHGYWTKNTATMNNSETYPGWTSSGIKDIVGTGVNDFLQGAVLNVGKNNRANANTVGNNDILYLPINYYNLNQTQWQAMAIDIQVVVPLATPQTINLTPQEVKTLLGYNSISSTGTVDVIYHADTKLYVDKMTNVDNNIIAPTEADFVATRNYTMNDLVIVNDMLYKCTANIANGSAITPNSNVQQTTLGALIKALS